MTRPRVAGRTMTSWPPMSFRRKHKMQKTEHKTHKKHKNFQSWRHFLRLLCSFMCLLCCVPVLLREAPALAQSQARMLADLIQAGNRKTALDRIRAGGTDVNEAQPDGTRPIHWAVY